MDEWMVFFADFFSWRQANGKKTTNNAIASTVSVPSWYSRRQSCCVPESCSENACWLWSYASRAQVGFRKFHWPQEQERRPEHVQRDPSWPNLMWLWVHPREQTQRWVHPEIYSAGDVSASALGGNPPGYPHSSRTVTFQQTKDICLQLNLKMTCNGCNNRLYRTFYIGAKAKSSHNKGFTPLWRFINADSSLLHFPLIYEFRYHWVKTPILILPFLSLKQLSIYLAALGLVACGIQFLDQSSNPGPLHWEYDVLTTGPLGKSLILPFLKLCLNNLLIVFKSSWPSYP